MNRLIKKQIAILALSAAVCVSLLFLGGCSKNESPNPCLKLAPTSAAFTMQEFFPAASTWKYYDTDTSANLDVLFTANDSLADSYEWHIGAGLYTERSKWLSFPSHLIGTSIPITLILKKKPNAVCFPQDDGIDTLTRKLYFIDHCNSLVQGDFLGSNITSKSDTFTVSIKLCQATSLQDNDLIYVSNLYRGCAAYNNVNAIGYRQIIPGTYDSNCQGADGLFKIASGKDSISIDYFIYDANFQNRTEYHFKGKRKK